MEHKAECAKAPGVDKKGREINFRSHYAEADLTATFNDSGEYIGITHGDLDLSQILNADADRAIEMEARDSYYKHMKAEKEAADEIRAQRRRDDENDFFVPMPRGRVVA